jgi:hypothetical protein
MINYNYCGLILPPSLRPLDECAKFKQAIDNHRRKIGLIEEEITQLNAGNYLLLPRSF